MRAERSWVTAATMTMCVALAGCEPTGPELPGDAQLAFVVVTAGSHAITTIAVEVSGPGIDSQLVFNFTVTGNVASGTARVPAGAGRVIAARAFDAAGVNTHRGDTTVTLVEGTNPAVNVVLRPLTGGQPLTLTIGSNVVSVNRQDTNLTAGDTLHLTATAVNWRGTVMPPESLVWASSNPSVAGVAAGIVTALVPGTATIVPSYEGAAARRIITVGAAPPPPPLPVEGDLVITEVMVRPTVGDANGEWFEIVNGSANTVSLSGLTIESGLQSFTIPSGVTLAPGAYLVFGLNADPGTNGGTPVNVPYSGVTLANGGDDLSIRNGATLIDAVSWTAGQVILGSAIQLDPSFTNAVSNDSPINWCLATVAYGAGDKGSPGAGNHAC